MKILATIAGTLCTLGAIGAVAPSGGSANSQPVARAAVPASAAPLTDEQKDALRAVLNLPPGATLDLEIVNEDDGSVRTRERGRGVGAAAIAEGDKLNENFNGSAPEVNLGADRSSRGGSADRQASASAVQVPPLPWQNPLFWVGLLALGGAGASIYFGLRRAAVICGVAGAGLLAAAFFPGLLLIVAAGAAVVLLLPYIRAEWEKNRSHEALRAVVAGVDDKTVPPEAKAAVKAAIRSESTEMDKATIKAVKKADEVGKYED